MAKILVAEDDRPLCQLIADHLKAQKHVVDTAFDGDEAEHLISLNTYDALILDWDMPFVSGIEILQKLRNRGTATPVLILTGKSSLDEKETGFSSGADDYLTKPFEMRELTFRLRALLRRPTALIMETLKFRGLELNTASRQLYKNGALIDLFPKELVLLEFFMKHPDQVFSLEALQKRVWPTDSETSPETIRVHIARLRSKIEESGKAPILKTLYRQGYMLSSNEDP